GVLITSARYFRQLAQGRAQALLPVDGEDLCAWRRGGRMPEQPEVLILSQSLDIPLQPLRDSLHRNITVLTGVDPDARSKQMLLDAGVAVVSGVHQQVRGGDIRHWMVQRGILSGYAIAGCGVLHSLLVDGALDRLFITTSHKLLGGSHFDTLLRDTLPHPVTLHLNTLYYDEEQMQMFADYTVGEDSGH
ncbi:MAG: pyrimidine reductase, partial [Mariprofundales bacterium]|nr:pyrimidine reductase [Mariprofundales bacterium]